MAALGKMTKSKRTGVAALLLLAAGCGGPPQMGIDAETFGEVDALFTAVTSRRPALLEASQSRLQSLREKGKIAEPAAVELDRFIAKAKGGEWEPAARELAAFMRGQRREGRTASR